MSCKKFRTEIEEAGRGVPLGASAATHVAACDSCRAFDAERVRLRALVSDLSRVEAPADFEFRLRARIARAGGDERTRATRRAFVPGAAWLTAAGCLVLALGIFVHFRNVAAREANALAQRETTAQRKTAVQRETAAQASVADQARAEQVATEDVSQAATGASDTRPTVVQSSTKTVESVFNERPKIVETAEVKSAARQASRAQRAARPERFVLPGEAVAEITGVEPAAARIESRSMDVKPSRIYYVGVPIPLPVGSADRKLEALFNDAHGAKHVVAVDPVAFGARNQASKDANAKNVSYTGVW